MSATGGDLWREMPLVAVPNFSEGRSTRVIGALEATLGSHARVLNRHYDAQHNRCVFTIAAEPPKLVEALLAGAEHAIDLIDMRGHQGLHPHIGALDVCPVVWQADERHDGAVAAARHVAKGIAALGIPVFFYGELATSPERVERAYFREGGPAELARRMKSGELKPDLGPAEPHTSAGATLVTAREPLVAFNVELDTPNPEIARTIAAELREAGGGLPGVRALAAPGEGTYSGKPSARLAQLGGDVRDLRVGVSSSRLKAASGGRAVTRAAPAVGCGRPGPKSGGGRRSIRRVSSAWPPRRK